MSQQNIVPPSPEQIPSQTPITPPMTPPVITPATNIAPAINVAPPMNTSLASPVILSAQPEQTQLEKIWATYKWHIIIVLLIILAYFAYNYYCEEHQSRLMVEEISAETPAIIREIINNQ